MSVEVKNGEIVLDGTGYKFEKIRELCLIYEQYRNIEKELGIDLMTFFKALKNGIWSKGGYYTDQLQEEPVFIKRPKASLCSYYDEVDENYITILSEKDVWCIYTYDYEIMVRQTRLKDYGKTWALTKEELL